MKIISDFITNSSETDYYDCDCDCDCKDCDCKDCDCDCDCKDCDCKDCDCDCDYDCIWSLEDYVNAAYGGDWASDESNSDCRD